MHVLFSETIFFGICAALALVIFLLRPLTLQDMTDKERATYNKDLKNYNLVVAACVVANVVIIGGKQVTGTWQVWGVNMVLTFLVILVSYPRLQHIARAARNI